MAGKEGDQSDVRLDDGTEDSYVGYMNPQNIQSFGAEAETDEPSDEEALEEDSLEEDFEEEEEGEEEEEEEPEKKPRKSAKSDLEKRKEIAKKKHQARMRRLNQMQQQPGGPYQQYNQPYHPQRQPTTHQNVQPQQQPEVQIPDIEIGAPKENESFAQYAQRVITEGIQKGMQGVAQAMPQMLQNAIPQAPQAQAPRGGQQAPQGGPSEEQIAAVKSSLAYLDEVYGDEWYLYEDEMTELYRNNPQHYGQDLDKLYEDGKQSYEGKNKASRAKKTKAKSVKFQTGRRPKGSTKTRKKDNARMNMNEAWERAKRDAPARLRGR